MILYFDTETTGLYPGNIIQLSYILADENGARGKNFYFSVDYIEPSATLVHGITVEKLKALSHGLDFSVYAEEILHDFSNADIVVAHNFKFDLSFLLAEFSRLNMQFRYNESFDTMRYFTPILKLQRKTSNAYKYPKLSELCEYYHVYEEEISKQVAEIFGETTNALHEARFDTTAMYLCVKHAKQDIQELEELLSPHQKELINRAIAR